MTNNQAAQHLNLLRLAGRIALEGNMLGQLLDGLPVIPLFLCFCHKRLHFS